MVVAQLIPNLRPLAEGNFGSDMAMNVLDLEIAYTNGHLGRLRCGIKLQRKGYCSDRRAD